MTVKKKRFEILLTKPFWGALDYLVEEGIYLERQEAARDAFRRLFRAYGIPPFYPQDADGKCTECGLLATHPSGLCRDCHQAKLEAGPP